MQYNAENVFLYDLVLSFPYVFLLAAYAFVWAVQLLHGVPTNMSYDNAFHKMSSLMIHLLSPAKANPKVPKTTPFWLALRDAILLHAASQDAAA